MFVKCPKLFPLAPKAYFASAKGASEKTQEDLCVLYAKMPKFCGAVLANSARARQSVENAPEARDQEYVILRAPPNTKENCVRERRRRERRKF